MSPRRWGLFGALALLFLLHNDLWLWGDRTLWFGLPAGLAYHVLYCLAAVLMMAALVRWAWPTHLEEGLESESDPGGRDRR